MSLTGNNQDIPFSPRRNLSMNKKSEQTTKTYQVFQLLKDESIMDTEFYEDFSKAKKRFDLIKKNHTKFSYNTLAAIMVLHTNNPNENTYEIIQELGLPFPYPHTQITTTYEEAIKLTNQLHNIVIKREKLTENDNPIDYMTNEERKLANSEPYSPVVSLHTRRSIIFFKKGTKEIEYILNFAKPYPRELILQEKNRLLI